MSSQPHDVDVKALLRVAVVYNIPMACNRSTADFIISSPLIQKDYKPTLKDYSAYLNRDIGWTFIIGINQQYSLIDLKIVFTLSSS